MSLVSVTVDIIRDAEVDDDYGGVTAAEYYAYRSLPATINYPTPRAVERSESTGAGGPGVRTQTRGIVKFEPKPEATVLVNDRVYVQETAERHLVIGVRSYEYTLQLDVERLA